MTLFRAFAFASAISIFAVPAVAQVAMQGSFVASKACPALLSIKKQSNPGNAAVIADGSGKRAQHIRITATKLWRRTDDWIFALGEAISS